MNKLRNSKLAQAGFSLVELLVVIAVIAIIAGIAIPQIVGTRDAAVSARDAARLEERTRFVNNVAGAGGPTLVAANLTNGQTVTVTNVAGNTTNEITFTFTEN